MSDRPRITILLSTFNGELYLGAQLDSILQQSYENWMLMIRDDGSIDNTLDIIRKYAGIADGRIVHDSSMNGNLGVKQSYSYLLSKNTDQYVAFADQDDVWEKSKLDTLLKRMLQAESSLGVHTPLVVYSDLAVVDDALKPIHSSFIEFSGLSESYAQANTILCRNVAPGCSMMMNAALVSKAGAIPAQAVMHDYWLMLVARFMGKIVFVPETLVKYRQHGRNQLGAQSHSTLKWRQVFRSFWWYLKGATFYLDRFAPYQQQAAALLSRFPDSIDRLKPVRAFVSLQPNEPRLRRKWRILRYGLKAGKFRENIELFLCA